MNKRMKAFIAENRECIHCGKKTKAKVKKALDKTREGKIRGYVIHFRCGGWWRKLRGKACKTRQLTHLID